MNYNEMELEHAYGKGFAVRCSNGRYPLATTITLCGHVSKIVEDLDAHVIYLPWYDMRVQVCCHCFSYLVGIYRVGEDLEFEATISKRYSHFKLDEHNYIWFGTTEQLQIALERI